MNRDFNPLNTNFSWVSQKVSREVNKRLGILKKQRNNLFHDQLRIFEEANILREIKQECLKYFRDKLDLKKL